MCSAQKWILPYQDLYVGYHYFLGIYHLLPFGSCELHVFVHRFFIQAFCFVHSIIHWFVPSFPSKLHSVSFLHSFHSCIHFHASIPFHSCIHFIPVLIFMPHSISFLYSFHSCIHFHWCFYFHFYIYDHSYIQILSCIHFHSCINVIHFQSSFAEFF